MRQLFKFIQVFGVAMLLTGGFVGGLWVIAISDHTIALANVGEFTIDRNNLEFSPIVDTFVTSRAAFWLRIDYGGPINITVFEAEIEPLVYEASHSHNPAIDINIQLLLGDGRRGFLRTEGGRSYSHTLKFQGPRLNDDHHEDIREVLTDFEAQDINWFIQHAITSFNLSTTFAEIYGIQISIEAVKVGSIIDGFLTINLNPHSYDALGIYEITYLTNATIYGAWIDYTQVI